MRPRCTEEGSTDKTKGKIEQTARKEKKSTTSRTKETTSAKDAFTYNLYELFEYACDHGQRT